MTPEDLKNLPFPYPLPAMNPDWLTSTVVTLATSIQDAGQWDKLPILADALQDAGCADVDLLSHLMTCPHKAGKFPDRNGGCWRGTCWVINRLLGDTQRVVAHVHTTAYDTWYTVGFSDSHDRRAIVDVVNPGEWFGKTWLVSHEASYWLDMQIVEADNPGEAEDEWVESVFGEAARIAPEELKDYEDIGEVDAEGRWTGLHTCSFTGSGIPYSSEEIRVGGRETSGRGHNFMPFPCVYYGPGIPLTGCTPLVYDSGTWDCVICGRECIIVKEFDDQQVCSAACLAEHRRIGAEVDV